MRWAGIGAAFIMAVGTVGCRQGNDEGCSVTEHEDISGTWIVEAVTTVASCDAESVNESQTRYVEVTQDGAHIEIDLTGPIMIGSICGDTFSARGSEIDDFLGCSATTRSSTSGSVEGDTIDATFTTSTELANSQACADLLRKAEQYGFEIGSCTTSTTVTGQR